MSQSQQNRQPRRAQSQRRPNQQPDAAMPSMQATPMPPQPERVVVVQKSGGGNPITALLRVITWPFRKVFGAIAWLVRVIAAAMVQSVISFIFGLVLLAIVVVLLGVYGVALVDSNLNAIQALSVALERIVAFFQMLLGIQQSVPTIPGN